MAACSSESKECAHKCESTGKTGPAQIDIRVTSSSVDQIWLGVDVVGGPGSDL